MALSYLTDINLNKNELQNVVIQKLGANPSSPAEGQIYYNSSDDTIYLNTSADPANPVWDSLGGDITGIDITAGTGLTGTVSTTSGQHTQTIDLADTAVTPGSYGSTTAIPVITVDQQGRLTSATTAAIVTTLDIAADSGTDDGVVLGTDTLTISGTANEIETSVSGDTITVGLPDDVTVGNDLTVLGNLQVTGTTTTNNVETVSTSNGVIFEGSVADANELTLLAGTVTADRTVTLPDATGTVALTSDITDRVYVASIGDGTATSYTVTHNLNTRDVNVQLYDNSSYDTVYADVVRTSVNVVTIDFGAAPTTNDIRVLVSKIG